MRGLLVFIVCAVLMAVFSGFIALNFGKLEVFSIAFIGLFYTYWTSGRGRNHNEEKDSPP